MILTGRSRVTGMLVLVLLAVTACGGQTSPPTRTQANASRVVRSYADVTAASVGAPIQTWQTATSACPASGEFSMTGTGSITLPTSEQYPDIARFRDLWVLMDFKITEFRADPPDNRTGNVEARNPADGITITVTSTQPPPAFTLRVSTPCYRPAPGEHPAG